MSDVVTTWRVLVIDDSPAIHEDFHKVLCADSTRNSSEIEVAAKELFADSAESKPPDRFEVDSAFHGEEGLEMIRTAAGQKRPYALAFVDIRMPPGWDGVETITRIWQEFPELQIIVCTVYSDYSWDDISRRLGQSDRLFILKKPFDVAQVRQLAVVTTQRRRMEDDLAVHRKHLEYLVEERTTELARANEELEQSNQQLEQEVAVRWAAEKELAKARDMANAANHAKGEFLANMSHEIRTPMTAILGFAEILVEKLVDCEDLAAAETIKRNGEYLLDIIDDILDLSKVEQGRLRVEQIACSPRQIIQEVVTLMSVRADAKGLPMEVTLERSVPDTIRTDPVRLRQVLVNLIGNAIKFTETGCVRIVGRLLDGEQDTPMLQVDVIDTGIGIAPAKLERLFAPFMQSDSSLTRQFSGTGLGLAISRRIAELLGGSISVRSIPGQGSTFSMKIDVQSPECSVSVDTPARRTADDGGARHNAPSEPISLDCRVLLVEDGPDNQRLISFLLRKAGATVVVAENGQVGLERVMASLPGCEQETPEPTEGPSEGFDVILMDMQMPVLDGYEATARIRQEGYNGPIIALTAHAMTYDRQRCLDIGCDDYLAKPVERDEFLRMVQKHVGEHRGEEELAMAGEARGQ